MSTEDNTGGPAFPALGRWGNGRTPESALQQDGMTLRDYFAAKAMQALLSSEIGTFEKDAEAAYMMADFMLKARG